MKPQDVIDVLHRFKAIEVVNRDYIDVEFSDANDSNERFTKEEFVEGSFTRDLFELIEFHLTHMNNTKD